MKSIGANTRVSGDYYRTLGLRPALGRLLTADDDHPGSAAAVISHGYWQRRFAGSPAVIGAAISLNQVPFTSSASSREDLPASTSACRQMSSSRFARASASKGAAATGTTPSPHGSRSWARPTGYADRAGG